MRAHSYEVTLRKEDGTLVTCGFNKSPFKAVLSARIARIYGPIINQ